MSLGEDGSSSSHRISAEDSSAHDNAAVEDWLFSSCRCDAGHQYEMARAKSLRRGFTVCPCCHLLTRNGNWERREERPGEQM